MQATQASPVSMERSSRLMLVAAYAAIVGAASFALNIGDGFGGENSIQHGHDRISQ